MEGRDRYQTQETEQLLRFQPPALDVAYGTSNYSQPNQTNERSRLYVDERGTGGEEPEEVEDGEYISTEYGETLQVPDYTLNLLLQKEIKNKFGGGLQRRKENLCRQYIHNWLLDEGEEVNEKLERCPQLIPPSATPTSSASVEDVDVLLTNQRIVFASHWSEDAAYLGKSSETCLGRLFISGSDYTSAKIEIEEQMFYSSVPLRSVKRFQIHTKEKVDIRSEHYRHFLQLCCPGYSFCCLYTLEVIYLLIILLSAILNVVYNDRVLTSVPTLSSIISIILFFLHLLYAFFSIPALLRLDNEVSRDVVVAVKYLRAFFSLVQFFMNIMVMIAFSSVEEVVEIVAVIFCILIVGDLVWFGLHFEKLNVSCIAWTTLFKSFKTRFSNPKKTEEKLKEYTIKKKLPDKVGMDISAERKRILSLFCDLGNQIEVWQIYLSDTVSVHTLRSFLKSLKTENFDRSDI